MLVREKMFSSKLLLLLSLIEMWIKTDTHIFVGGSMQELADNIHDEDKLPWSLFLTRLKIGIGD